MSLYPNPANENLTIEIEASEFTQDMQLILINSLGATVKSFLLDAPTTRLDLKDLSSGIYFYSIKNQKNASKSGKFIVE